MKVYLVVNEKVRNFKVESSYSIYKDGKKAYKEFEKLVNLEQKDFPNDLTFEDYGSAILLYEENSYPKNYTLISVLEKEIE